MKTLIDIIEIVTWPARSFGRLLNNFAAAAEQCRPRRKPGIRLPNGASFEERFWIKVDKREPNECWPWLAGKLKGGYAYIGLPGGGTGQGHRIAYELCVGPIPEGAVVRHKCDFPSCCNPAHLEPGTQRDNMQDAARRGRTRRKLPTEAIPKIVKAWRSGSSMNALGRRYGVHTAAIRQVLIGESYSHITGINPGAPLQRPIAEAA
jgi:hypothetical protein